MREVTRVVDVVDETRLAELALTATAAQLARMISGFRSAEGMRISQQAKRQMTWREREDGMIDVRARLPKDEATVLLKAIDAAKDQFGPPPPKPDPCGDAEQSEPAPGVGSYSNVDALVDVARGFLATAPQDRSGEDRTLVVVHVSADNLTREGADVPAGTSQPAEAVCHLAGVGPVEPATAQRLACDNRVLGAIVDKRGQVLALGRTRRLVSKAQRRALLIRDRMCRYPGCHSTRHLKEASEVDFAVMVVNSVDTANVRGQDRNIARDNVIFELGLFSGGIGRERTFMVYDRTSPPDLPTDLLGVRPATYQPHASGNLEPALGAACNQIRHAMLRLGPRQSRLVKRLGEATT